MIKIVIISMLFILRKDGQRIDFLDRQDVPIYKKMCKTENTFKTKNNT
jgi:hypothetical protein